MSFKFLASLRRDESPNASQYLTAVACAHVHSAQNEAMAAMPIGHLTSAIYAGPLPAKFGGWCKVLRVLDSI